MLSKLGAKARNELRTALLINLGMWTGRLIKRSDRTFDPVFWLSAILGIAVTTLVTYACYLVIDKALNFAGWLLKRITRGGATSILVLGMVSIFLFS